jgi:hypothetical protein
MVEFEAYEPWFYLCSIVLFGMLGCFYILLPEFRNANTETRKHMQKIADAQYVLWQLRRVIVGLGIFLLVASLLCGYLRYEQLPFWNHPLPISKHLLDWPAEDHRYYRPY